MIRLVFLIALIFPLILADKTYRVNISNGEIEGVSFISTYSPFGNQTGIVFLGIPHIQPPIGGLRFRKPRSYVKKWNGTLETKKYKPACMSNPAKTFIGGQTGTMSEDCLFSNVFTNEYCLKHKNCSVMVFVHGGQLLNESPASFKEEHIINNFVGQHRNVIVVTLPYRLGMFSHINWDGDIDGVADKNIPYHDILEGLRWVQREIKNFGGLPQNVTLFGHSGGALIAYALMLSKLSKGLYQKQVMMSSPIRAISKSATTKFTKKFALKAGCITQEQLNIRMELKDTNETFECLRKLTAEQIYQHHLEVYLNETEFYVELIIDNDLITDHPQRLIHKDDFEKRPTMIGNVKQEASLTQTLIDDNNQVNMTALHDFCKTYAMLGAYTKPYQFVDQCVSFYSNITRTPFFFADKEYMMTSYYGAVANEQIGSYLYDYSYSGAGDAFTGRSPDENYSPIHSEDFLYYLGLHRGVMTKKDFEIERILTGQLANFVNFGDPTYLKESKWEKFNSSKSNYFEIDFDNNMKMQGMKNGFNDEEVTFWKDTIKNTSGDFTYSEIYNPSFDIFPIHWYMTAKFAIRNGIAYGEGKGVELSKRIIKEVDELAMKIESEQSTMKSTNPQTYCIFLLFLLALLKYFDL